MLSTDNMGGVTVTEQQLHDMHAGDYILHARSGKLKEIPVQKTRMPLDPKAHYQLLSLIVSPRQIIYATQETIISRSKDGGNTWEHLKRNIHSLVQFNSDGALLRIRHTALSSDIPAVWASEDEGSTWDQIGQIEIAPFEKVVVGSMTRLSDGTLLVPVKNMNAISPRGANPLYVFRSKDGGKTFPYRSIIGDWCGDETNIVELPSGRLLAVVRYQPGPHGRANPFKHVFLADSEDGGETWTNLRQLTTVFGQCHGAGVGLSANRVVVAHDHRYPRKMGSGRAMVSHDGGQNWDDEVYYLCHGHCAGFPRHITVDGEEILTFIGSYYGDVDKGWHHLIGRSHFVLIRWKLI